VSLFLAQLFVCIQLVLRIGFIFYIGRFPQIFLCLLIEELIGIGRNLIVMRRGITGVSGIGRNHMSWLLLVCLLVIHLT
jgi:hypothetical protein